MKFTLYDTTSGKILGVLDVEDKKQAEGSAGPGQAVVAGTFDGRTHMIFDGGAPVEIPEEELARRRLGEAWVELRARRDALLAACDWTQAADAPVDPVPWRAYRKALRDLPKTVTDPTAVIWPTQPE